MVVQVLFYLERKMRNKETKIYTQTVDVKRLIKAIDVEYLKYKEQRDLIVHKLKQNYKWIPKCFLIHQQVGNKLIRSAEEYSRLYFDHLDFIIRDLIEKKWITKSGKPIPEKKIKRKSKRAIHSSTTKKII